MPDSQAQLAQVEQAAKKAEEAAVRAEKAAARPKYWLITGFAFALVGAVLAFALKDSDPSVLGVRMQPFGGVIFGAGVILLAGAAIGSMGGNGGADSTSIKSIGGLIAVVVGITAVTALTVVTLTQLGDESESIVAVTTSAFGIISAVVGAYLGIKISSDTTAKATDEAKDAAVAQNEAEVAQQKLLAMTKSVEKKVPEHADEIKAEGYKLGEEATRTGDPPLQGGAPP